MPLCIGKASFTEVRGRWLIRVNGKGLLQVQVDAEWTLRPNDAMAPKDASEGGIAGVSEVSYTYLWTYFRL